MTVKSIKTTTTARSTKGNVKGSIPEAQRAEAKPAAFSREAFEQMISGFELPSGKRIIVSMLAGIVLAGGLTYLGINLVVMATVGAAMLTGSAFISFMVMFIGYALTIIAAAVLGGKFQAYVLSAGIDRDAKRVWNWLGAKTDAVGGWFSKDVELAERAA